MGTVAQIKAGRIAVYGALERLTATGVRFADGTEQPFDTLLLATGYEAGLLALFPGMDPATLGLDARGLPAQAVGAGARQGLHFVGFDIRQPGGLLRTIALQAQTVSEAVARDLERAPV